MIYLRIKRAFAFQAFHALLACASTVLFWGTFLCSPIEPSVNAGETVPSETGKVVRTWKSKLVKSDKTLLEIVKEEAPNIEVIPIQIFFSQRLYDLTFDRYLPFYRLKEAAVLATYEEAAECLDQIKTLSGKEKACVLFALTIFENKYRPRPQWLLEHLAPKEGVEDLPYFPYHDIRKENPLELWTCDYEPDATIEPSFWERWEKTYREAFRDEREAFTAIKTANASFFRELYHAAAFSEFYETHYDAYRKAYRDSMYVWVDEFVTTWNRELENCIPKLEEYAETPIDSFAFLLGFNVRRFTHAVEKDPSRKIIQVLQKFEQYESDNASEIQRAYALREYLLLLTYYGYDDTEPAPKRYNYETSGNMKKPTTLPNALTEFDLWRSSITEYQDDSCSTWLSYNPELLVFLHDDIHFVSVNSSFRAKTVGRVARELQTARLSYDGSILIPNNSYLQYLEETKNGAGPYFDEWETRLRKTNKSLLEVVKKESKVIETLPYFRARNGMFVSYDMTFARYLPVYRLKEAALASTYAEALECLEQLDTLSGKEKVCALYALSYFVRKRGPSSETFDPVFEEKITRGAKPLATYYGENFEYRSYYDRIMEGGWKPDYTIERSFWTRWKIALKKALDDKEIAFPAIASSKEKYGSTSALARSSKDDELTSAWFDNIDACAKLAEKYVEPRRSKFFSFSSRKVKAADFLAPCMNEALGVLVSKQEPNAKSASKIDPNSFAARFLKGVDRFYSDDVAEMQEAYALREYWMNLHDEVPTITTWSDAAGKKVVIPYAKEVVNNLYRSKTVGEIVAKEIRK